MLVNEYNGFRNRETWLVNLWIANDEGLHNEVDSMIAESLRKAIYKSTKKCSKDRFLAERTIYSLASKIREFLQEHVPVSDGLYGDLLGNALAEVDYDQLADLYVRDCLAESEGE